MPGQDFFVAYSPEREDPGRKDFSTSTIPKLVGGIDDTSTELATALYAPFTLGGLRTLPGGEVVTADGRAGIFQTVHVPVIWHGHSKTLRAQVMNEPLIGVRLLKGSELFANWMVGGEFRITPLAETP